MRLNFRSGLVACAVFLTLSPAVRAEETPKAQAKAQAQAQFREGQNNYTLGQFTEALEHYTEAFRLDPLPPILFNIAQCHRQLGAHERAAFFYRRYLSYFPPGAAPREKRVQELLAEVETKANQSSAIASAQTSAVQTPALIPTPPAESFSPAPLVESVAPTSIASTSAKPSLLTRWWFWAGVGVIAAGAVTTVALTRPGPPEPSLGGADLR